MTTQLELISSQDDWQLDEPTRDAGRRGVEQARAALLAARRRLADHDEHPARVDHHEAA